MSVKTNAEFKKFGWGGGEGGGLAEEALGTVVPREGVKSVTIAEGIGGRFSVVNNS